MRKRQNHSARYWLPVAVMVLGLLGCRSTTPDGHDHDNGSDAGHDHAHAEGLVLSGWSKDLEAHAEFPYLAADGPSPMLLHLTRLPEGRPVEGPITLRWDGPGGATREDVLTGPWRSGIYGQQIHLPVAGSWNLSVAVGAETPEVLLRDIPVAMDEHEAAHHHPEHAVGDGEMVITMTKEQQWLLGVAGAPVERRAYTHPVRVAARVEAIPERRVVLRSEVGGRLVAAEDRPLPTLGQKVRAGDTLMEILVPLTGDAGRILETEAARVRAEKDLQLARQEMERARSLMEMGAAPGRRVEEARSALEAAQARFQAALRLHEGRNPSLPLVSPIDGVIVAVDAAAGAFVEPGSPVVTILDADRVWVRGHIPETLLNKLSTAPHARLGIHRDLREPCRIGGARFIYLAPEIDPASRTAAVVYEVANEDGHLRPGQSLGLALDTLTTEDGIVIPDAAIVNDHGRPVVFVQITGEEFVKRPITLGGRDGAQALVTSGLADGERIVVRAPWAVKLAAVETAAPGHGHAH